MHELLLPTAEDDRGLYPADLRPGERLLLLLMQREPLYGRDGRFLFRGIGRGVDPRTVASAIRNGFIHRVPAPRLWPGAAGFRELRLTPPGRDMARRVRRTYGKNANAAQLR